MTREEQIREAGIHYDDTYCTGGIRDAFESGAEWADENPKSPWISVKDRLPEAEEMVFVSFGDTYVKGVGYMSDDVEEYWYINGWGCIDDVTHWMPIPKLQEERV